MLRRQAPVPPALQIPPLVPRSVSTLLFPLNLKYSWGVAPLAIETHSYSLCLLPSESVPNPYCKNVCLASSTAQANRVAKAKAAPCSPTTASADNSSFWTPLLLPRSPSGYPPSFSCTPLSRASATHSQPGLSPFLRHLLDRASPGQGPGSDSDFKDAPDCLWKYLSHA